ncbi:hypothetical protein Fbal_2355 [Ferrimonas balearica DSM 9799]|uniref:Uncharacterized protein n=1 Tax=Ferrimonas balearica (strain DSM 9799 / CCM 4581 / KCTC 23876 / PAT) TaxID=550540 RepID=E1SM39_FERBD|nr:hypothetical protein [Ferrimonas balearica]ADN76557.1 hypothetical protein Fbal_2355 [Ferrimonas balearica DSM 9799]MBY5980646.1 hypothetical protein [Ferrimonas balearica]MBY6019788.1 hypothetical protein [Halomonas denitrificans]
MLLMILATMLNVVGVAMLLAEPTGNGLWVLLSGVTLTLMPWLRQLTGLKILNRVS